MLTDQEMQQIAEQYISFLMKDSNKVLIVFPGPIKNLMETYIDTILKN